MALKAAPKVVIAGIIAVISLIGYCSRAVTNPVTGKTQHISLSHTQEIALGLQSAPELIRQFGGPSRNAPAVKLVNRVGERLLMAINAHLPRDANPYQYDFHLLDDDRTINAFALPGGQVFITEALLRRLETEGQLAGVLGHEIGHVLGRHSAERLAKAELTQQLIGAVTVAASDGRAGAYTAQQIAGVVGGMINLKYGRGDELESDRLAVRFLFWAGYDPRALIGVMEILAQATGGSGKPDFASTHPDPGRRIEVIKAEIEKQWPGGLPKTLEP